MSVPDSPRTVKSGAAHLALVQLGVEQRRFWRNPMSAGFTFGFPVMFLVIFATLNQNSKVNSLGNISFNQYFVPAIVAFGVMGACFSNLAIQLPFRRDDGQLKRVRGTPMPRESFLSGVLLNAFLVSVVLVIITLAAGAVIYGVHFEGRQLGALILALFVGAASFAALGLATTAVIPNADAAPAIVNLVFFPLLFLSGSFFPVDSGTVLAKVANVFPVRHFNLAVFAAFDPHRVSSAPAWGHLGVLALWGVAAFAVARCRFRWEPRDA